MRHKEAKCKSVTLQDMKVDILGNSQDILGFLALEMAHSLVLSMSHKVNIMEVQYRII